MTIESGTTSDRRNRVLIFLAMCLFFAGWYARDGFLKYPAKNFDWARQNLARVEGLAQRTDLKTNPKALLESLNKVRPGMSVAEVKALLGEPTFANQRDCCYIGPAAYGWFTLADGKIGEVKKVEMNSEPTESDIRLNKTIAGLMGVLAVVTLVQLPLEQRHAHDCPRCIYQGSQHTPVGQRDWYTCPTGWTDTDVVCRLSAEPADIIQAPAHLAGLSPFIDEAIHLGVIADTTSPY